jgi:hypothetical protein
MNAAGRTTMRVMSVQPITIPQKPSDASDRRSIASRAS